MFIRTISNVLLRTKMTFNDLSVYMAICEQSIFITVKSRKVIERLYFKQKGVKVKSEL